jgi:hypothetical protein
MSVVRLGSQKSHEGGRGIFSREGEEPLTNKNDFSLEIYKGGA